MNGFNKLMIQKLYYLFGFEMEDILNEELNYIEMADALQYEIPEEEVCLT